MQPHFVVMATPASVQGLAFFAGMDQDNRPIWEGPNQAMHFPTFQQAARAARRVRGDVCASFGNHYPHPHQGDKA